MSMIEHAVGVVSLECFVEIDHMDHDEMGSLLLDIMAENAKLRELSSIMLKCIMANERKALICWECPMHKQFDELRSYCCLKHEAKELGIEATV